jgi:hypothetical protein
MHLFFEHTKVQNIIEIDILSGCCILMFLVRQSRF